MESVGDRMLLTTCVWNIAGGYTFGDYFRPSFELKILIYLKKSEAVGLDKPLQIPILFLESDNLSAFIAECASRMISNDLED